ncbi:MAG: hypothetical protein U9N83_10270 [Thermodesulfobacteriota bacterium]|nr:hypothetical protein [Thermodesulfobacteriota bacterium]
MAIFPDNGGMPEEYSRMSNKHANIKKRYLLNIHERIGNSAGPEFGSEFVDLAS